AEPGEDRHRGVTERLARASAARPRRTFVLWGVAVLAALALVATSLHGLSSNSHVVGKPDSAKAADAIAQAFPRVSAEAKQDVIVLGSSRYLVTSPRFRIFGERLAARLRATGDVAGLRPVAVSPDRHSALVSLHIRSDAGAASVESLVEKANGGGFTVGITGYRTTNHDFG